MRRSHRYGWGKSMSRCEGSSKSRRDRMSECDGWAWSKEWTKANGRRVHSERWITRIAVFIVNLYILDIGKLFKSSSQWLHNAIWRAIGLAFSFQINVKNAVPEVNAAVSDKSIPGRGDACVLFCGVRSFEVLVHNGNDWIC